MKFAVLFDSVFYFIIGIRFFGQPNSDEDFLQFAARRERGRRIAKSYERGLPIRAESMSKEPILRWERRAFPIVGDPNLPKWSKHNPIRP
jgi:hypothetical protein